MQNEILLDKLKKNSSKKKSLPIAPLTKHDMRFLQVGEVVSEPLAKHWERFQQ